MKRMLIAIALVAILPAISFAQNNNVGNCGWGSKLFDGQKGIAPQVLAVTTNGTSGNQTFAITSGTSGCTQDGVVHTSWKTAAFIDQNMSKLALDMSRGQGESMQSLASLLGVASGDQSHFNTTLQSHVAQIFPSASADSKSVSSALKDILASDASLAQYADRV